MIVVCLFTACVHIACVSNFIQQRRLFIRMNMYLFVYDNRVSTNGSKLARQAKCMRTRSGYYALQYETGSFLLLVYALQYCTLAFLCCCVVACEPVFQELTFINMYSG